MRVTLARTSRLNCGYSCSSCRDTAVHVGASLFDGDAVAQARHRQDAGMPAAIVGQCCGPRAQWHIQIGGLKEFEVGRQHADDGVRLLIEIRAICPRTSCARRSAASRDRDSTRRRRLLQVDRRQPRNPRPTGRSRAKHRQERRGHLPCRAAAPPRRQPVSVICVVRTRPSIQTTDCDRASRCSFDTTRKSVWETMAALR